MCHSITVFILEMDERLRPRFIAEPTQGFKPSSINFIFAAVSKHGDSLIWAAQVDNALGFLFSNSEINRSVWNASWILDLTRVQAWAIVPTHVGLDIKVRKEGWKRLSAVIFPSRKQVWLSVFISLCVWLNTRRSAGERVRRRGLLGLSVQLCGVFFCCFSCCWS